MRHFLLLLITLTLFGNVSGQKIEFSESFNSGLFSFRRGYAVGNTFVQAQGNTCIVSNAYGSKGGLCYGVSFNIKKIIKKKYFFGVDLGYEVLRSRAKITSGYENIPNPSGQGYTSIQLNISGNAFTNNSFINAYPFIGYRCKYKEINFDLTGGADIGYYLKIYESGNAKKSDGTKYYFIFPDLLKYQDIDFRPRLQLTTSYKKFGVYFGYSYGIFRYSDSAPSMASKVIRFGITYKLSTTK
jgi:hypothetical protein